MGYLPAAGLPAPGQNAGTPPGRLTTGPTLSTIRQRRPQAPGRNEWLKVPHLRALTSGIHPPLMGSSGWYTVYLPQSPSGACIPGGRGHCLSIYQAAAGSPPRTTPTTALLLGLLAAAHVDAAARVAAHPLETEPAGKRRLSGRAASGAGTTHPPPLYGDSPWPPAARLVGVVAPAKIGRGTAVGGRRGAARRLRRQRAAARGVSRGCR